MAPTKKTAAAAAVPVIPTPEPVVVAPATETATETTVVVAVDDLTTRFAAAVEKLLAFANSHKELVAAFKALQKDVAKLQKRDGRKSRKTGGADPTKTGAPRNPSGFAKPTALSAELCEFLGVPGDSMLARTEVTRLLNKYVKDNNLQDAVDKRTIRADAKLQKVLNLKGDTQLTYFNLQSHIKHHFIKADPATAAVPVAAA